MPARAGATSARYVTIKARGRTDCMPKKIMIPTSMATLKAAAGKALGGVKPIVFFAQESGKNITNIGEISVNSTIVAVYDSGKRKPPGPTQTGCIRMNRSESSAAASEAGSEASATPRVSKISQTALKPTTPTLALRRNVMETSGTMKASPAAVDMDSYSSNEPSDDDEYPYSDASEDQAVEVEQEPDMSDAHVSEQIMASVIPISGLSGDIVHAFSELNPESQEFLTTSLAIEASHQSHHVKGIMKALESVGMFPDVEELDAAVELKAKARRIVASSRIAGYGGANYLFRSAIVGPGHSGKSTLMRVILKELLVDLVATDNWKKTFIFPLDVSALVGNEDSSVIFKKWIQHVFLMLRVQVPSMIDFLPCIEKAFSELESTTGIAALPRKISQAPQYRKLANDLQGILSNMAALWFNPTALIPWWTSVAMLPKLLANAFGFRHIVFVYDHFDDLSLSVKPSYPFEDSTMPAMLSEIWKFSLQYGAFIVGAHYSDLLIGVMDQFDDASCDAGQVTKYYNTLDTVKKPLYRDREIILRDEKTNDLLKITCAACAGIPIYLKSWYELNEEIDELEKLDRGGDAYEEKMCDVSSFSETVLALLFAGPESSRTNPLAGISISEVMRRTISK